MIKILVSFSVAVLLSALGVVSAQCPAGRYVTSLFPSVIVDSVTYSVPYNLKMDIYQPSGDVLPARPLVILAHGGSFVSGNRRDDVTVDTMCRRLASRGYVTASIDYRLGNLISMALDSLEAINTVIKAVSDGKAAIRYFVKDAATTNTYRIDTNNIFVGGNSAGAVLYLHAGYLNTLAECPPALGAAIAANGGIEGNSGNSTYTTKLKAIVNLAGGLNTVGFIEFADKPSVNVQGDADNVVPYNCANAIGGAVQVQLCGLGVLQPAYAARSVYHMSMVMAGEGHVPWNADLLKQNTVDSFVTDFLYKMVCTNVAELNDGVGSTPIIQCYPNPANNTINISTHSAMVEIVCYDLLGKVLKRIPGAGSTAAETNVADLPEGLYIAKIMYKNPQIAADIIQFRIGH